MQLNIRHEEDFGKLLDSLADDLVQANIHFRLYEDLKKSIPEFVSIFNESNAFWHLTFRSHLDATLFRLCRVYDQYNTSLSLLNWLDTIKANIHIFDVPNFKKRLKDNPFVESLASESRRPDEEQLDIDIEFASERNPLVKKLIILRNNLYAHKSEKNVRLERDLLKTYPIKHKEIGSLLKDGISILNRYASLFRAQIFSTQMVGHDDYLHVLNCVKSYLDNLKAEREAEYHRYSEIKNKKTT